jgi:hypothetical protein
MVEIHKKHAEVI